LPAPCRCRSNACKCQRYDAERCSITPPSAAAATNPSPGPNIQRQLRRSAQAAPPLPADQIPITGSRLTTGPRVPSSEAFGRRPSAPVHTATAHRHPKPFTKSDLASLTAATSPRDPEARSAAPCDILGEEKNREV